MSRLGILPAGWGLVVIMLLIQLAALNTGENLMYLLASGTFSFLVLSFFLARWTCSRLRVSREAPKGVHRDEPFGVTVKLENRKRRMPAFSLHVTGAARGVGSRAYLARVPAMGTAIIRVSETLTKRGVHPLPPVTVASSFPFGLVLRRRVFETPTEVVVYPRVRAVRTNVVEQLRGSGQAPKIRGGDGDEFFSLRDYAPGDDPRRIVWRASARLGHLVVRDMEVNVSRSVFILFDTRLEPYVEDYEEPFEEAVELVASLAVSLLNRNYAVSVVAPDRSVPLG